MIEIEIEGNPAIDIGDDYLESLIIAWRGLASQIYTGKNVTPFCFVICDNYQNQSGVFVIPFFFENNKKKNKLKSYIYGMCKLYNAKFALFTADMWVARSDYPDYMQKKRPSKDPNRTEAVCAVIMTPDGSTNILSLKYERINNKIKLDASARWIEDSGMRHGFFIPPWKPKQEVIND